MEGVEIFFDEEDQLWQRDQGQLLELLIFGFKRDYDVDSDNLQIVLVKVVRKDKDNDINVKLSDILIIS